MKLATFITQNMEQILSQWDDFAKTLLPAAKSMSPAALRDDARQILESIARDMAAADRASPAGHPARPQDGASVGDENPDSAAAEHGTLRQMSGFSLIQLTAEYRALRASVLRLWLPKLAQSSEHITADLVRFNETIDQALAESVVTYSMQTARTRDTFLAVLGHDLRSPLSTMTMAGELLSQPLVDDVQVRKVGARVKRSAATMSNMVHDLLEYARTQLGGEMPITGAPADMHDVCRWAIDDASAAHPDCHFELKAAGDLHFTFDAARMQQVLSNLLNNAAQYRAAGHPVTLLARGEADAVAVEVRNFGSVIAPESLQAIFNPLVQLSVAPDQKGPQTTSLGLGLFIAREITEAHGGSIAVESSKATGTAFIVRLPRGARAD